ncbi:hypothetical protein PHLCEN_2v4068 [Hermanssonia centrifuga]|uniref:Uncharacterized protein n=1 Tax=Hermanssonia centrifuga TaxID=98765 RepID=A0A2R6Q5C3_9APHY|nr:hypothetical protein PHLCEN_2v4068 [Hermanssonia centrifuga]
MHLFWENTLPNLAYLWVGDLIGLKSGTENYTLDRSVWDSIGKTRFDVPFNTIRKYITVEHVEVFGKVQHLNGGDIMNTSSLVSHAEDCRNATWICYDILVDQNATCRNAPSQFEVESFYAQLINIFVVHLPLAQKLGNQNATDLLLAEVRTSKSTIRNELDMPCYKDFAPNQVIDMNCVQGLVGRVQVMELNKIWTIIDRMRGLNKAIYANEDV